MLTYRLKSAIVAIERSKHGMLITNVPHGSVLTLPDPNQQSGMIEVVWQGRYVSIFVQDVRERGEYVDAKSA